MSKKNLLNLLFIVCQSLVFAQTSEKNSEKYWYYRFRLINNFTLVGDCQGCSLPVTERNYLLKDGTPPPYALRCIL